MLTKEFQRLAESQVISKYQSLGPKYGSLDCVLFPTI